MDLKPENIVLSRNIHAILIDLSGIGGTTRKWLSPEMRSLPEPFSQGIEARKQNDIWTLGLILPAMAHATCNAMEHHGTATGCCTAHFDGNFARRRV